MRTFTVQEVGCALASQNLTATQYAQMTSALALEGETVTLTTAKVQEAAATAQLASTQTSALISTLELSTAQRGLSISAMLARGSVVALNAVVGLGLGLLVMGVTKALSALSDKLYDVTHKSEVLKDAIKDLSLETDDIQSEINKLNDKLEETKDRLDELSKTDTLNITDAAETTELQKQNELLEAQIALKQRELEIKNDETNTTIENWYKEAWQTDTKGDLVLEEQNGIESEHYISKTEEQYFQEQLDRAEWLYTKQKRLSQYVASLSPDKIASMTTEQITALQLTEDEQDELQEIQAYLTGITGELNQQISGYTVMNDKQQAVVDNWNNIILTAAKYASYDLWSAPSVDKDENDLGVEAVIDEIKSLDQYLKSLLI